MEEEDDKTMDKNKKSEESKKSDNNEKVKEESKEESKDEPKKEPKVYPNARNCWMLWEIRLYFIILALTLLGFIVLLYLKIVEANKRRAALKYS